MINTLLIIIMTIIAYTLIGGLLLIIVRKTACVIEVIRLLTYTHILPKDVRDKKATDPELIAIAGLWPIWLIMLIFKSFGKLIESYFLKRHQKQTKKIKKEVIEYFEYISKVTKNPTVKLNCEDMIKELKGE